MADAQIASVVADSALAEVPECGEVAADLRVTHADGRRDAAARDLAAVRGPGGETPQVEA